MVGRNKFAISWSGVCCWCSRNPANAPSWYVGAFIPHPVEKKGFLPRWCKNSEPAIVGDVSKRNMRMSCPIIRSLSWLHMSFELSLQLLHRIINKSRNHWRFPARNCIFGMPTIPALLYYLLSYLGKCNIFCGWKPRYVLLISALFCSVFAASGFALHQEAFAISFTRGFWSRNQWHRGGAWRRCEWKPFAHWR